MVKQQYYRTQGSKNQAVKSRVKENRVKYFQNFLLFSFFSWRKATNSPVPGKIFIDPIAAAFLSPCEHLAHREFPTAVTCLCPGFGTKPSQVSLNFHSFKTFSHLPLMQLCGLATGLHRGQAGMGTGDVFSVWGQLGAALAGLPRCGTGLGRLWPLHLPSLPPCNTRIVGAELPLLCSPCLTKRGGFSLPQQHAAPVVSCLGREIKQRNINVKDILEKVATLAKHRPDEIPDSFSFNLFWL